MPDPDPPLEGDTFPVAVIEGMNHYQWGSEEPPTLEKKRDIQARSCATLNPNSLPQSGSKHTHAH